MRVKRGVTSKKRHKKLFKAVKGFRGRRKNTVKLATDALTHAGRNAYRDRRKKKRDFRSLWITRLNAALKLQGVQYSRFIRQMEEKKVLLNRKTLSELAISKPEAFKKVVETVMG
ncbi:MAG TPA: 50S ribosomal protein L20 [Candidatus Peribacterales bacterium]|nr:50S ribosomal protein L20 [Candidatus Peribacterales bacterium]